MRAPLNLLGLLLVGLLVLPAGLMAAEAVDYERQVKPILAARCFACHGGLRQQSQLRLDTVALAVQGGESGAAIVPGDSAASLLIQYVTADEDSRMPPEGKPLEPAQIALLKSWIDAGARGSKDEQPEADPRAHWAFQKPVRPPLPKLEGAAWTGNPIDSLLAAEHERRGLAPRPEAPRHVLLRRLYIDLVGLPPTRDELHAFLDDTSPDAYAKVVDRLLASPRYGERWGRHWMDVWRYSDWYGRRGVNDVRNSYPTIWRWRDWIVRSLNEDKGYDRMVMEMLAGDEIAPDDDETIVATGYLVRSWYKLNYNTWMKDLVEHTGKSFVGLTMNCAMCHDHKYDAISQREYFQFRAFFEPLELRQDRWLGDPDPGPYTGYIYGSSLAPIEGGMVRIHDKTLDAKTYMTVLGDERNRMEGEPPAEPAAPALLDGDRLTVEPIELPLTAYYPGLKAKLQHEDLDKQLRAVASAKGALDRANGKLAAATSRLDQLEDGHEAEVRDAVASAEAAAVLQQAHWEAAEGQLKSLEARIAVENARYRGADQNIDQLAAAASEAERHAALYAAREGVVRAEQALADARQKATADGDDKAKADVQKAQQKLADADTARAAAEKALKEGGDAYTPLSPTYPKQSTGRRTALARWIAGRDNPLTARVAVNHIWMRHFGDPLVSSVYDFGRNGQPPINPQLLDWLAVELMDGGWRMKHLHRRIVTSNAYRMRSDGGAADSGNLKIDPDNRYLWRMNPRRAEAEVVRDSVLYVAGQLDTRLGGREIELDRALESRRRSLYISHHAEAKLPVLALFDAPEPGQCYRRTETIVPQQALAMTNSNMVRNQSRRLADRLSRQIEAEGAGREAAFITVVFEQVLSRAPTESELAACERFLDRQAELYRRSELETPSGDDAAKIVPPATRPDLRARQSLVHALYNHNDFVTVR